MDIGAGGPSPFRITWAPTSDKPWVSISPSEGSISPSAPEQRVVLSVYWIKVSGMQSTTITVPGQRSVQGTVALKANHTTVSSGFSGAPSVPSVMLTSADTGRRRSACGGFMEGTEQCPS